MGGGIQRPNWHVHFESPILSRLEAWRLTRENRAHREKIQADIGAKIAASDPNTGVSGSVGHSPREALRLVPSMPPEDNGNG